MGVRQHLAEAAEAVLQSHPAAGADRETLVRALHGEVRHRIAEVVGVRRHHGRRRLDLQIVVQALLMRQDTRTQARQVMRHRHRLAVVVLGGVYDLVLHRLKIS